MGGGNSQWGKAGLLEEVRPSEHMLGLGVEAKVGTPPAALPGPWAVGPQGLWVVKPAFLEEGRGREIPSGGSESAALS